MRELPHLSLARVAASRFRGAPILLPVDVRADGARLVGLQRVGAPVCRWSADHRHDQPGELGRLYRELHFPVGVAAAAVMLVIPAYIYKKEYMHEVVLFGELMAIAVIVMCLLFVTVDLGHPERFHHMIPPFGMFNFPGSILSWDVIVLNGYLVLNLHIAGYLLYCRYRQRRRPEKFYIPFVFLSIAWAVSIHTVTAFLYVGLAGRSYWHHPLVPSAVSGLGVCRRARRS